MMSESVEVGPIFEYEEVDGNEFVGVKEGIGSVPAELVEEGREVGRKRSGGCATGGVWAIEVE